MANSGAAIFIHLAWATKQRLPLIDAALRGPLYDAIGAACRKCGASVIAIGGVEDHIHLLVQLPLTISVADLMHQVKGMSSYLITHALHPSTAFKWQEGYGACSVSTYGLSRVQHYIAHQAEHHAANTLHDQLERFE